MGGDLNWHQITWYSILVDSSFNELIFKTEADLDIACMHCY